MEEITITNIFTYKHDPLKLKLVTKVFLCSIAVYLCLMLGSGDLHGSEIYSIDNRPLYLYKTINWWYDCLPEECNRLCGRSIQCKNEGNTQIEYDEQNQKMNVKIRGGFAGLLLTTKKCTQCFGPSTFYAVWLNPKYFKNMTTTIIQNDASTINGITFSNVKKEQAQQIQKIQDYLQFVIEGVIGGLSSGQIALHESGLLLNKCLKDEQEHKDFYPIVFNIFDARTGDRLAIFKMLWEH